MAPEIIGRDDELAVLHAFLANAGGPPAALVVEGDVGIGKSTLFVATVAHAKEKDGASSRRGSRRQSGSCWSRGGSTTPVA